MSPLIPNMIRKVHATRCGIPADTPSQSTVTLEKEPIHSAILRGLSYSLLLVTFAIAFLTIAFPMIVGAVPLTVLSNSMAPTMPVGSLAIVQPTKSVVGADQTVILSPAQIRAQNNLSDIKVGDIIVYEPNAGDPTLVMHRVINIETSWRQGELYTEFITKGDNLTTLDAPVHDFQVPGRVRYSLPYLGYVNNLLNAGANGKRTTLAVVVIGYGLTVSYIVRGARERLRKVPNQVEPCAV